MLPILSIPLALAIFVLTKNQVVLSCKLALALGQKGTPQELVGPVAGIIGSSLIWRQVARTLAGLVPFIGLPKSGRPYLFCAIPHDSASNRGPLIERLLP